MTPSGVLGDERLTTAGLFFEASTGLQKTLERRLTPDCGMSVQWFEVLLRLARSPGERLRMSELAAQSSVTASGLTRVVDRLVEAGFVARESCPDDRRSWYAALTDAGRDRIHAAVPAHLRDIQEIVGGVLSPEEMQAFAATMRKLRDALNPAAAGDLCRIIDEVAADAAAASRR
jgi:DNA-binding MarR family transcriptional regulator